MAPPRAEPPAPSRPTIEGLQLRELLGAGGFGAVWAAASGDRAVAVKIAHESTDVVLERSVREAAAQCLAEGLPPPVFDADRRLQELDLLE